MIELFFSLVALFGSLVMIALIFGIMIIIYVLFRAFMDAFNSGNKKG